MCARCVLSFKHLMKDGMRSKDGIKKYNLHSHLFTHSIYTFSQELSHSKIWNIVDKLFNSKESGRAKCIWLIVCHQKTASPSDHPKTISWQHFWEVTASAKKENRHTNIKQNNACGSKGATWSEVLLKDFGQILGFLWQVLFNCKSTLNILVTSLSLKNF